MAFVTGDVAAVLEADVADRDPAVAREHDGGPRPPRSGRSPRPCPSRRVRCRPGSRTATARTTGRSKWLIRCRHVVPSTTPADRQARVALERAHRGRGRVAEDAVDGERGPSLLVELALEHGDRLARVPGPEPTTRKRAQVGPFDHAGHWQALRGLERPDRRDRRRVVDARDTPGRSCRDGGGGPGSRGRRRRGCRRSGAGSWACRPRQSRRRPGSAPRRTRRSAGVGCDRDMAVRLQGRHGRLHPPERPRRSAPMRSVDRRLGGCT